MGNDIHRNDFNRRRSMLVGLRRVRGCCVFTWEVLEGSSDRRFSLREDHCTGCVEEMKKLGYEITATVERGR